MGDSVSNDNKTRAFKQYLDGVSAALDLLIDAIHKTANRLPKECGEGKSASLTNEQLNLFMLRDRVRGHQRSIVALFQPSVGARIYGVADHHKIQIERDTAAFSNFEDFARAVKADLGDSWCHDRRTGERVTKNRRQHWIIVGNALLSRLGQHEAEVTIRAKDRFGRYGVGIVEKKQKN